MSEALLFMQLATALTWQLAADSSGHSMEGAVCPFETTLSTMPVLFQPLTCRAVRQLRGVRGVGAPQVPAAVLRPHRAGMCHFYGFCVALFCIPQQSVALPAPMALAQAPATGVTCVAAFLPLASCSWWTLSQRTPRPPPARWSGRRPSGEYMGEPN